MGPPGTPLKAPQDIPLKGHRGTRPKGPLVIPHKEGPRDTPHKEGPQDTPLRGVPLDTPRTPSTLKLLATLLLRGTHSRGVPPATPLKGEPLVTPRRVGPTPHKGPPATPPPPVALKLTPALIKLPHLPMVPHLGHPVTQGKPPATQGRRLATQEPLRQLAGTQGRPLGPPRRPPGTGLTPGLAPVPPSKLKPSPRPSRLLISTRTVPPSGPRACSMPPRTPPCSGRP